MVLIIVAIVSIMLGLVVAYSGERFQISNPLVYVLTGLVAMVGGLLQGQINLQAACIAGLCFVGAWVISKRLQS